jgi:hypothetical protein
MNAGGCYRPGMRLETRRWKTRTWFAVKNMNNPTRKHGGVTQKNVLTELKRMTRWGAAREAENAPALLRAAAGSLWSILVWEDFWRVNPRSIDLSHNGCHILSNLQSSDAD